MIKAIKWQAAALVAALAACAGFALLLLDTEYYMLVFCGVAACFAYLLSKYFGREIYILFLFPKLFLANQLTETYFNMSSTNEDLLNPFKVHMFTLIILFAMALEFLELLYTWDFHWDGVVLCGLGVLVIFTGITLWRRGGQGLGLLLESYFGPFLLFLLYYIKRDMSYVRMRGVMTAMLIAICAAALLGFVEAHYQYNPHTAIFLQGTGYSGQMAGKYRVFGTVGHIIFPMLMLAGCFLARGLVKSVALRVALYGFFTWATVFSQTRTMLVLILFYTVGTEALRILKRDFSVGALVKIAAVVMALGIMLFAVLARTAVGQSFLMRFLEDSGSGEARTVFIRYFFENLFRMPLLGVGAFPDVVTLVDSTGSQIIPEIPWIMLYFEVGPLFLGLLLFFLLLVMWSGDMPLELLMLLIAYTPYTSFTAKNQCFFLFFIMASYGLSRKRYREEAETGIPSPGSPGAFAVPRGVGAVALALLALLSGVFGATLGASQVARMTRMYRSHAELYLYPDVELAADLDYLDQNRGGAMWLYTHMNNDVAEIAQTPMVEQRMRRLYEARTGTALGRTDLAAHMQAENVLNSRILRISFSSEDPNKAALMANVYAEALVEVMDEIAGYQVLSIIGEATPAQVPYSPRPYAQVVVCGCWGTMVFLTLYLAMDCLRKTVGARELPAPQTS